MKITEAMVAEMAHHLTAVNQNDFYGALKAALAAAPEVRWPCATWKNGKPYGYCPECGQEEPDKQGEIHEL